MLLDAQNLFSDNQTITSGSIVSENIVRFGKNDVSFVPLLIQATNDFSNLTSLTVKVETSDSEAFETPVVLAQSSLVKDELKQGSTFPITYLPKGNKGYIRLVFEVIGEAETTGTITAGVVASNELNCKDM